MADRGKIIELLTEIAEYFRQCRDNASFASKAENHFWELQNAANEAVELLKAQEQTPSGWVSVKDRLPEKSGEYLCWFGANKVAIGPAIEAYVDEWKTFVYLKTLEKFPNITHWMPLPEPPKEG